MSIAIRVAEPQDTPAVRQLWETCFPDPSGFNAFFFREGYYVPAFTLLLEEEGTLCAMTQMLPCHLRMTGGSGTPLEVAATYIYGACTAPAFRRRGYMAALLRYSFARDQQAGRAASLLIPAEPWLFDFYRPFGYESFFTIEQHTVTSDAGGDDSALPNGGEQASTPLLPRRLTPSDIPALAARYEAVPAACRMCRTATDWTALLRLFDTLGKGAYGWFEAGRLTAYAFCWADNAQEAIGLTPQQEQGLLCILACDSLTYTTYEQQIPLAQGSPPDSLSNNPSDGPSSHAAKATGATAAGVVTQTLGCIKWYPAHSGQPACSVPTVSAGYMNLMLN